MRSESKILIVLLGVVILAIVYFFPVKNMMADTKQIEVENTNLTNQINEILPSVSKEKEYKTETEEWKRKTDEIIKTFPSFIRVENEIMRLVDLEKQFNLNFSSLTVSPAVALTTNDETTSNSPSEETSATETSDGDAGTQSTPPAETKKGIKDTYLLHELPVSISFTSGYDNFKNLIDVLAKKESPKNIDAVSVTFDKSNGEMTGTIDYKPYFMAGSDIPYEEIEIKGIQHGSNNVFGTVEIKKKKKKDK